MAVRRMFHRDVICGDDFLELPFSAQALFIQIAMAADDDGFFNGARRIARSMGAQESDLKLLVDRRFLLQFGSVVVVKHWRMCNSLKNDRLRPPSFPDIAEQIFLKPNKSYTDHPCEGAQNLLEEKLMALQARNPSGFPEEEKREEEKIKEINLKEQRSEEGRLEEGSEGQGKARNPPDLPRKRTINEWREKIYGMNA